MSNKTHQGYAFHAVGSTLKLMGYSFLGLRFVTKGLG